MAKVFEGSQIDIRMGRTLTSLVGEDVVVLAHYIRIVGRLTVGKNCNGQSFFQVAFAGQPNETVCARFDETTVYAVEGFTIILMN